MRTHSFRQPATPAAYHVAAPEPPILRSALINVAIAFRLLTSRRASAKGSSGSALYDGNLRSGEVIDPASSETISYERGLSELANKAVAPSSVLVHLEIEWSRE
jgi:hypothetical protein